MEKFFLLALSYSFLLFPLCSLIKRSKLDPITTILSFYGIIFYLLINFDEYIPKNLKQLSQAIYTVLEYSVFTFILFYYLKNKDQKRIITFSSIGFLVFIIIFNISPRSNRIDSIPVGVETLLIFVYSFFYFRQFFVSANNVSFKSPGFLLIVGILTYLSGTFFFNIFVNYLSKDEVRNYWWITYAIETIKNILFAIAILKIKQKSKKNIQFFSKKALY